MGAILAIVIVSPMLWLFFRMSKATAENEVRIKADARAQLSAWTASAAARQLQIDASHAEPVMVIDPHFGRRDPGPEDYTLTWFLRNAVGQYVMLKSNPKGPYVKLVVDGVAKVVLKERYLPPGE